MTKFHIMEHAGVGGDFFQVIPLESGGALIAVGDVSGKGMPAAMTVSLLVATFRTLAHYTQRPSEILGSMNRRMLSRSQGGGRRLREGRRGRAPACRGSVSEGSA
jgi:serine phosphatase RsbU (regulator of sigma subunit)